MYELDEMREAGFTRRMAEELLSQMEAERASGLFDESYLEWAHSKGFLAESACAYGLNEDNVGRYLSDYDYARLFPLNDWERIWINDKLTLRYVLAGAGWGDLLPAYHFYITAEGVRHIPGSGNADGVVSLASRLRADGELACKPCNGQQSQGFHRLSSDGTGLYVDGRLAGEDEFAEFARSRRNYIVTEFIRPEQSLAAIHPLIHTLRVLVARTGGSFRVIAAYLRFGQGGGGNYVLAGADASNYTVRVDLGTGEYGDGRAVFADRVEDSPRHPMTGVIAEGALPDWEGIVGTALGIAESLGFVDYLGFDFGVTDKGLRLMEINSHSGMKYIQALSPVLDNDDASEFFESRLAALDRLTDKEREAKWRLQR